MNDCSYWQGDHAGWPGIRRSTLPEGRIGAPYFFENDRRNQTRPVSYLSFVDDPRNGRVAWPGKKKTGPE
ncbi:MAG: hypothetical protein MI923_24350 [Phycisphaerales bacterium]|nr:hypothetical protein [Phycisphaerales bacterium]